MDWLTSPPPPVAWGLSSAAAPAGATEHNLGRARDGGSLDGSQQEDREETLGPLSPPPPNGHQTASVQSLRDLPPHGPKLCFSVKL